MPKLFFVIVWIILTIYLFYIRDSYRYTTTIVTQHTHALGGNENVMSSLVRSTIEKKYNIMLRRAEATHNTKTDADWLSLLASRAIRNMSVRYPEPKIIEVCRRLEGGTRLDFAKESHVFGLVWNTFIQQKYDMSVLRSAMIDCFEDDHLVCATGRVARYIGALTIVATDELGEKEITDDLLFQEALREAGQILRQELERAGLTAAYDAGETVDVSAIRELMRTRLQKNYPQLPERISEIIEAI